jgi:hypothetical protein
MPEDNQGVTPPHLRNLGNLPPPNQDTEVDELLNAMGYGNTHNKLSKAQAKTALNQYYKSILLESLERLLVNGHGGGNFRRLIELEKGRLESRLG